MNFWTFFKYSLILLVAFAIIFTGFINVIKWERPISLALYAGLGLSFFNFILGFAILSWGIRQSQKDFMLSVYGGMFFRILLIFSFLFILIKAFQLHTLALAMSLLITYLSFLMLEIYQIHRSAEKAEK